jgi:hypothetical protein
MIAGNAAIVGAVAAGNLKLDDHTTGPAVITDSTCLTSSSIGWVRNSDSPNRPQVACAEVKCSSSNGPLSRAGSSGKGR